MRETPAKLIERFRHMATNDKTSAEIAAPAAPAVPAADAVKAERKGKQLSATVTPEFYARFSDLQWDLRKPVPELIRQAAEEFLAKNTAPEATDAKA